MTPGNAAASENLSNAEQAVRAAFLAGQPCDLSSSDPSLNDAFGTDVWGPERSVRGEVLSDLLLRAVKLDAAEPIRFRLEGARIAGTIDVGCGKVAPFLFTNCRFDSSPFLNDAECTFIGFLNCKLPGISANRVQCSGAVWLDGSMTTGDLILEDSTLYDLSFSGIRVESTKLCFCGARIEHDVILRGASIVGGVCCSRAHVGGVFSCSRAKLRHQGEASNAIYAYLLEVNGSVFLDDKFECHGSIDLEGCRIGGALVLVDSMISAENEVAVDIDHGEVRLGIMAKKIRVFGGMRMHHARVGCQLNLAGGTIENPGGFSLKADHIVVEGALMMSDGFRAEGTVDLHGAELICTWNMSGATFSRRLSGSTHVVSANNLTINGHLLADRASFDGGVAFMNSHITGSLQAKGATLANPNLVALNLREADINGSITLSSNFASKGALVLSNASVGTDVDLRDAQVCDVEDRSISATSLRVGGDFKASGFDTDGLVDLSSSSIDGSIRLTDSSLRGLSLSESTYGTPRDLNDGGHFRGTSLRISRAEIGGDVDLSGSHLSEALVASKAVIGRGLILGRTSLSTTGPNVVCADNLRAESIRLHLRETPNAGIDLCSAKIGMLDDTLMSWPASTTSNVDGLEYADLGSSQDLAARLSWLKRTSVTYSPRPYEQLAQFYEQDGDERSSRAIRLQSQRRRHRESGLGMQIWGGLQDVTVGFGYAPGRAAIIALALWLSASLILLAAAPHCPAISPEFIGLCPIKADEHPTWDPFLYSLDLIVPAVDLGQEKSWDPAGWSKVLSYTLIVSGWILVATIIAAGSRVLQRR